MDGWRAKSAGEWEAVSAHPLLLVHTLSRGLTGLWTSVSSPILTHKLLSIHIPWDTRQTPETPRRQDTVLAVRVKRQGLKKWVSFAKCKWWTGTADPNFFWSKLISKFSSHSFHFMHTDLQSIKNMLVYQYILYLKKSHKSKFLKNEMKVNKNWSSNVFIPHTTEHLVPPVNTLVGVHCSRQSLGSGQEERSW